REAAERAVRARENVLGVVSHDLRSPLNTIVMCATLLCDTLAAGEGQAAARNQLRIIQRSADRMNRLIEDLLDLARIEAGRLSIHAAPVSAESLAREACELIHPLAREEGQIFVCEVSAPLPEVHADRDRIHQVLSNLAANAVKFTPTGG